MATLLFTGGVNQQDVALVHPEECVEGYNCELGFNQTSFRPRKPFDLMGTSTNAGDIRGIIQLIKTDASETTLIQSGDTVYDWDGSSTFTSKGTVSATSKLRGTTWSLDDYAVITDLSKETVVKKWDGTTLSTLTTGIEPTDLYAKYAVVHLGRMWLFNVKAGTDTPHLMTASAFEDPTSYDVSAVRGGEGTGSEAIFMTTPDLLPINGVVLWQGILIISTEGGRLWKLTGSDASDFAWVDFYNGSFATGEETMSSIGNDVVYMKRDGVIESLVGTERFGDVSANDLSKWIRTLTAGVDATSTISVYDQSRQKVYFFGGSNKLLVLFKDLLPTEYSPWMLYKTDHASSFSTKAASYIREAGGNAASDHYVYWGDDSGNIYRMDGTGSGDNGTVDIETTRKTGFIQRMESDLTPLAKVTHNKRQMNTRRNRIRGRVYYRRISAPSLIMDFEWADDFATNRCTVPLEGPLAGDEASHFNGSAYFGGDYYFNTGFTLSHTNATKGFSAIGRGPGVFVLTSITTSQEFDILKIEI